MQGFLIISLLIVIAVIIQDRISNGDWADGGTICFATVVIVVLSLGVGCFVSLVAAVSIEPSWELTTTQIPISMETSINGESIYFYDVIDSYTFIVEEENGRLARYSLSKSKIVHIPSDERKVEVYHADFANSVARFFFLNIHEATYYKVYCPEDEIEIKVEDAVDMGVLT